VEPTVPINAIDLSAGKKIKVLAYNPDPALIGKKLNIELEKGTIDNGIAVLKTAFTTSGAWEELVFDFGTIAAIPNGAKFTQLVLRLMTHQMEQVLLYMLTISDKPIKKIIMIQYTKYYLAFVMLVLDRQLQKEGVQHGQPYCSF
jgi:hypothetical protein